MRTFNSLWNYSVLGLGILTVLLLAACGGGEDSVTPSPTPTTDPVGTVERISFSDSGELNLIRQEYGEVTVNLKAGDVLRVTFNVSATSPRNPDNPSGFQIPGAGTILTVIDPMGDQIIAEGKGTGQTEEFTFEVNDTFEVVADMDGEHRIGFFNPLELQLLIVKFQYFVNP